MSTITLKILQDAGYEIKRGDKEKVSAIEDSVNEYEAMGYSYPTALAYACADHELTMENTSWEDFQKEQENQFR